LQLKRHFTDSFVGELVPMRYMVDENHDDEVRDKRRRSAYRYILLLLAVILLPIVANNIYIRQVLPAAAALLLLGILMANILLLSINREAFLALPVVVAMSIALVMLSLYHGQNYSLYLLFPLLVALPIVLQTRWAMILGVLSGLVAAPVVFTQYDATTAAALGTSMGLTWLVSAWLVFAMTEQSRRLKDMAITDALTGAFNRRYLELQAARGLQDWERHQRSVSLLMLDIDNFKKINDEFGHSVGDVALKSLVTLIKERIRGVDTLCRFGGEEFVLLLSETTDTQARAVANQLRRAVESTPLLPRGRMTVSVGVCDVRQVPDIQTWFKLADGALYSAKNLGRNRVEMAESLPGFVAASAMTLRKTVAGQR